MKKHIKGSLLLIGLFLATLLTAQETGIAAIYGDEFDGSKTASGQPYDKNKLTAAHKIHPMGTQLRVTRTDEKARRSVVVTVNDRGPYIAGRIVDLSRAAARKIGLTNGLANVLVEVVGKNEPATTQAKPAAAPAPAKVVVPTPAKENPAPAAPQPEKEQPVPVSTKPTPTVPAQPPAAEKLQSKSGGTSVVSASKTIDTKAFPLVRGAYKPFGLFKIALHQSANKGFGVQIMALQSPDQLLEEIAELQGKWFDNVLVSVQPAADGKTPVYKIILGPFATQSSAKGYAENLKKKHKIEGFIVDLESIAY